MAEGAVSYTAVGEGGCRLYFCHRYAPSICLTFAGTSARPHSHLILILILTLTQVYGLLGVY